MLSGTSILPLVGLTSQLAELSFSGLLYRCAGSLGGFRGTGKSFFTSSGY